MQKIALIATMRNEGPYLIEWIAYHRLIGFTDILVCTNDCVDGSPDLLDVLTKQGLVRHIRCYPGPADKAQLHAYSRAEAILASAWPDVLMVLDADEYLNIHVGAGTVTDLLGTMGTATAMLINWRIFGNAGHVGWSAESVIRRYTRAARQGNGVNLSFKTLFTRPDAYHCPLLPHGPGHAKADRLPGLRAIDGGGHLLPVAYARSEGFMQSEPGTVSWGLAQVNHYNTRSWEDYLAKHDRGGGLDPERWARDENWAIFNRNEEEDRTVQRHLPALDRAVADLLANVRIRAAHDRCLFLYGAHVDRLRAAA